MTYARQGLMDAAARGLRAALKWPFLPPKESAWRVPGHLGKPGVTHHNEACRVGSLPSPEHGGAAHHLDSEL
jgi:hypothetical protein